MPKKVKQQPVWMFVTVELLHLSQTDALLAFGKFYFTVWIHSSQQFETQLRVNKLHL